MKAIPEPMLAKLYDEQKGTTIAPAYENLPEPVAKQRYQALREQLYPSFKAWERAADRILDAQLEATG